MEPRKDRQLLSVFVDRHNMISCTLFVMLLIVALGKSDALITCVCSDCTSRTCLGHICYSQVSIGIEPEAEPVYRQRCYFQAQASACNTSSDWHTTLCCESDRCNENLDPMLSSGDSSTSSADYLLSTDPLSSSADDSGSLEPTITVTTSTSPPPPVIMPFGGSCYMSDSSRSAEVRLCTLETYCFSTLRRKTNGTVVHKRGCSNSCTEETRNRKIKRCCTDSLCNQLIQDPLEGTTTTPTPRETTPPPPPSSQPSPRPPPTTSGSPLITYSPPSLDPRPPPSTEPTSAPPTTPPADRPTIICYCNMCDEEATICTTSGACATLVTYHIPSPGSVPSGDPKSLLTITKFCISNLMAGCEESQSMSTGQDLRCCNTSYCNNYEIPSEVTTTVGGPMASTTVSGTESTSDDPSPTTRTTPTPPESMSSRSLDLYFIVGIGVFIVAGVILVIVVIAVICYCCITRRNMSSSSSSKKAKKGCSSTPAVIGADAAATKMEIAVGTKLSFPSPNIYAKQRESLSVSTEGNGSSSGGSSAPVLEGIPRTAYSSTSV